MVIGPTFTFAPKCCKHARDLNTCSSGATISVRCPWLIRVLGLLQLEPKCYKHAHDLNTCSFGATISVRCPWLSRVLAAIARSRTRQSSLTRSPAIGWGRRIYPMVIGPTFTFARTSISAGWLTHLFPCSSVYLV